MAIVTHEQGKMGALLIGLVFAAFLLAHITTVIAIQTGDASNAA